MEPHASQVPALTFLDSWVASNQQTACLQGYAGTGKTWLVGYWLRKLHRERPNWKISVLAPTNKALDVLRIKCADIGNLAFSTTDSFLGYRIKKDDDREVIRSFGKGQDVPDLVVCDEASMVKLEYAQALSRKASKLLWVGDPAQLPPINEDLSTCFNTPNKFLMTEVVRFEGSIIKIATMLRHRIESQQSFVLPDIRQLKEDETVSFIHVDKLHDWALTAIDKGLDARIIGWTNECVNNHNAVLHQTLFPDAPLFGPGERVVVNETFDMGNDDLLLNGEMLTVNSCTRAEDVAGVVIYDVQFTRDSTPEVYIDDELQPVQFWNVQVALDEGHMLRVHKQLTMEIHRLRQTVGSAPQVKDLLDLRKPLNKLAPLRHSYACTVHKSQGSTYDIAFCDWGNIYRSTDRARLMYVAVTRPSKYLVVACR